MTGNAWLQRKPTASESLTQGSFQNFKQRQTKHKEKADAVSSLSQGARGRQTLAIFSAIGCEQVGQVQGVPLQLVALETKVC